jgi:hypothetical protein
MAQGDTSPPWLGKLSTKLVEVIPRLKTPIQLAGFALAIAATIVIRLTNPGAEKLQIGAVVAGIVFIFWGQFFVALPHYPKETRAGLTIASFLIACIFLLCVLAILTVVGVTTAPSVTINIPKGWTLQQVVNTIADEAGGTAIFNSTCPEPFLSTQVREGTISDKDQPRLMRQVAHRLIDAKVNLEMEITKDGGSYEISCVH